MPVRMFYSVFPRRLMKEKAIGCSKQEDMPTRPPIYRKWPKRQVGMLRVAINHHSGRKKIAGFRGTSGFSDFLKVSEVVVLAFLVR